MKIKRQNLFYVLRLLRCLRGDILYDHGEIYADLEAVIKKLEEMADG